VSHRERQVQTSGGGMGRGRGQSCTLNEAYCRRHVSRGVAKPMRAGVEKRRRTISTCAGATIEEQARLGPKLGVPTFLSEAATEQDPVSADDRGLVLAGVQEGASSAFRA
jgi:hypothetical protein